MSKEYPYFYEVDELKRVVNVLDSETREKLTELNEKELIETHSREEVRNLIKEKLNVK